MTDQHDASPSGVSAQGDHAPSAPGTGPSERADIPREDDGCCCPSCGVALSLTAIIPPRQVMYFEITHEKPFLQARTVGRTIDNAARLLKAVAKDVGSDMEVFLHSIEKKELSLKIGLLMLRQPDKVKA